MRIFKALLLLPVLSASLAQAQPSADYSSTLVLSTANSKYFDIWETVLDEAGTVFFIGVEGTGKEGSNTLVIGRQDMTLHTPVALGYMPPYSLLRLDAAGMERIAFAGSANGGVELWLSDSGTPTSVVQSISAGGAAYDIPLGTAPSLSQNGTLLFSARKRCVDESSQNVVVAMDTAMAGSELGDGCADPMYRGSNIYTALSPSGRYAAVAISNFTGTAEHRVVLIDRQGGSAGQGSNTTQIANSMTDASLVGLNRFLSVSVNDSGEVAFSTAFTSAPSYRVMVASAGNSPRTVADASLVDAAASIDHVEIASSGDIAFFAKNFTNDMGLFHYSASTGAVQLVIRDGDTVQGILANQIEWVRGGSNNAGQLAALLLNNTGKHLVRFDPLTLPTPADVTLTLTGPSTAMVDTPVMYRATVFNAGPSDAEGVELELSVPSHLNLISSPGCAPSPQSQEKLLCPVGMLAVNATQTLDFELSNPVQEQLTMLAVVRATTEDPFLQSNEATVVTTFETSPPPPPPGCALISLGILSATDGPSANITLELRNESEIEATEVEVEVTIVSPEQRVIRADGAFNADRWTLGSVPASTTKQLQLQLAGPSPISIDAQLLGATQSLCPTEPVSMSSPYYDLSIELSVEDKTCDEAPVSFSVMVQAGPTGTDDGARLLIDARDPRDASKVALSNDAGCTLNEGCAIGALSAQGRFETKGTIAAEDCATLELLASLSVPEGARWSKKTVSARYEPGPPPEAKCLCVSRADTSISSFALLLFALCAMRRRETSGISSPMRP